MTVEVLDQRTPIILAREPFRAFFSASFPHSRFGYCAYCFINVSSLAQRCSQSTLSFASGCRVLRPSLVVDVLVNRAPIIMVSEPFRAFSSFLYSIVFCLYWQTQDELRKGLESYGNVVCWLWLCYGLELELTCFWFTVTYPYVITDAYFYGSSY